MYTTVFTCGDINGIGPEIVVKSLNQGLNSRNKRIIFICPKNIFLNTISQINTKFKFIIAKDIPHHWNNQDIIILDIGYCKQSMGKATKSSGLTSYKAINVACDLLEKGYADAVVTAPISKMAFSKANINFPGHTEMFAARFRVKKFAMMFVSNKMRAGLVTIHIPISFVKKKLTKHRIFSTIDVIYYSLKSDFNISKPRIACLGLNPHAGEEGNIGNEEIKIIQPAINESRYKVFGPFVPDAYFGNKSYKNFDCTIGIYHDQILIPFKLLNFNKGVNYTAGLPFVRTSPDHGTAYDIAGSGKANVGSIIEAFNFAQKILKNRRVYFGRY